MRIEQSIDIKGRKVTRAKVLAAIAECDRLGQHGFLDRYGYGRSTRFALRHNGRSYPSKAILGVAAGLKPSQLFGGVHHTARSLGRLGFHVRNLETGRIVDVKLDGLRRQVIREGFNAGNQAWPELPVDPSAYFCSGSNRPAEIRGLAKAGADIGVAAPELSADAERELAELAGSDIQVFVDSGAFSEVRFGPNGVEVVKPITDAAWRDILALYARLASALGSQLWLVAPDMVGDQSESLTRLERYRSEVRHLRALGARILLPVQKGTLSQANFARQAAKILGFSDFVPALPCKKAATTAEETAEFARQWDAEHVHLLGLGIRSPKAQSYLEAFRGSRTSVSLDSCWITANVGRTSGPGKGPRRFTLARDFAKRVIERLNFSVAVAELAIYSCFAGSGLA